MKICIFLWVKTVICQIELLGLNATKSKNCYLSHILVNFDPKVTKISKRSKNSTTIHISNIVKPKVMNSPQNN